mmetsp:Transcript_77808/g.137219  ORF Transcript_77808/g.137219 Transcript_77808/m.137219 type:complete len:252 (+) Transcript_77808:233-988(+)|eukprot:CAMPEP_0197641182 /NCGR_PEP_ID=MMETSP1338-20131121/15222_1 /TAXON_ID=43686 ORGANISM="Pelagodinium beii, Strain RCC1491" /NCGR_SAMPLE_ID=MMETSP1338 /ASSEMBLY_ACC=CAM_ASM_000754 /LENGTH=251 /DNA_ID=CAMNT_0043214121 /DNA_START=239 /DNA_END=994 /DNA_ORIENTATION=+
MAFTRDHGTCCICMPLKLGVSIVSMLVVTDAMVCIIASMTGDIRFQPNGYSETFYHLPTYVGVGGLFFGMIGILGIYDDKPDWMRALVYFLFCKVAAIAVSCLADYITLGKCNSWLSSIEHITNENEQLTKLAEADLCPFGRFAYALGASIVITFWVYCTYKTWLYLKQIELNPAYPLDFGIEKHDSTARWKFFQVKDPRLDPDEEDDPLLRGHEDEEEEMTTRSTGTTNFTKNAGSYGPDGQRSAQKIDF